MKRDVLPWLVGAATFAIPAAAVWWIPIALPYFDGAVLWPMIGCAVCGLSAGLLMTQRSQATIVPVLASAGIAVLAVSWLNDLRTGLIGTSCANHSGFWYGMIDKWTKSHDRLPPEYMDLIYPEIRQHPESMYCPGRAGTRFESGYVYVGDGIPADVVKKRGPLILFCASGGPAHCYHAFVNGETTPAGNADLVSMLRKAIEQGERGEVPYSPRAMNWMRSELAIRQEGR